MIMTRISSTASAWLLALCLAFAGKAAEVQRISSHGWWEFEGELEETSLRGKFCAYFDSRVTCAHGIGSVGTDGGETYEGRFVNGDLDGNGTYVNDAFDYVGAFKQGRFHGHGVVTCASGRRFEGEFVDGKLIGQAEPPSTIDRGTRILRGEDDNRWYELCD